MKKLCPLLLATLLAVSLLANIFGVDDKLHQSARPAGQASQPDEQTERRVESNVLVSNQMPAIRIKVDKAFKYVGNLQFPLKGIAQVERFVFAVADRKHIKRLFVVQFEGFLDGNEHTYKYRITNPVTLGGQVYNQNTWFFDNAQNIRDNPGAESDKMTAFLKQKGYSLDDELMMSRFVRVVDEAKRHEIIIYYLENLKDAGFPLSDYAGDNPPSERQMELQKALTARSLKSFTILE